MVVVGVVLSALTFALALEYSLDATIYWGQGYAPINIFDWPRVPVQNLGLRYVGDAVVWWGASLYVLVSAITYLRTIRKSL